MAAAGLTSTCEPLKPKEAEIKDIGIDLHAKNCVVVIIEERDILVSKRRVANRLDAVLAVLAPHKDDVGRVAVESTYNRYWCKQAADAVLLPRQAIDNHRYAQQLLRGW